MKSSLKIPLLLLGPPALIGVIAFGVIWWDRGAPPGFLPTVHEVSVRDLNRNHRGVKVEGMARYDIRIKQESEDKSTTHYLYPLMPPDDINSKQINVMVRSKIAPERNVDMERLSIEGLARPPGLIITQEVVDAWREEGYKFEKKFVLIDSFDRHGNSEKED